MSIVNYFHSIDRTTHCGLPTSPDVLVLTEFVKLKFSNIPQRVFVIKHLFVKISPLWILTTLGPLHHFLLANNGRVTYLKDIKTNFAIFVVSSEKNLFEINSNSAEATSPSSKWCHTITEGRGNNRHPEVDGKEKIWSNSRTENSYLRKNRLQNNFEHKSCWVI